MKIADVAECLESFAPLNLQESYDNSGLLTGNFQWECTGILCTLDVTVEVIEEAVRHGCNCIVAHHPLIFRGIKKLSGRGFVEQGVIAALRNGVAIYACHTNLDNVPEGVNGRIADKLQLRHRHVLSESIAGMGAGMVGELPQAVSAPEFLDLLKRNFDLQVIRHTRPGAGRIARVGVCGGAGSFLISNALAAGADAFVTSDVRYHEFFDAEGRMLLCDIGHFESEPFTIDLLIEILLRKFPTFAVLKSEVNTNPVHYFTGK